MSASGSSVIKLQMLLCPDWRHEGGVATVIDELQQLGIKVTASGRVTVSAETSHETFRHLFGREPDTEAFDAPSLPVPISLRPYVENVSVVPRHIRMRSQRKD
jgi:hypothetical protein